MNQKNLVIVGHVDHGKSTLIGRILFDAKSLPEGFIEQIKKTCEELGKEMEFGFILDSLEEERKQGITIDTTQIFFKWKKRDYTIIDAPGHVEFIRNMITGASQADAAILIVDAKRGIEEQTKRHSYILSLLGIKKIVVVINKMDLVNWDVSIYEKIKKELEEILKKLNLEVHSIIPVSAKDGDNVVNKSKRIDSGETLLESLDRIGIEEGEKGKLRFPVQDVYKFDERRILVGRVESGEMQKGEEVLLQPSGKKTKIKSIENWSNKKEKLDLGESGGIVLEEPLFVERGEVITREPIKIKKIFKVNLFWISSPESNPILKLTTQESRCKIKANKIINSSTLEEKDTQEINDIVQGEVKCEKEIVFDDFSEIPNMGRFILENEEGETIGAGIITD